MISWEMKLSSTLAVENRKVIDELDFSYPGNYN